MTLISKFYRKFRFSYIFGDITWVLHAKHEYVFEISVSLMIFKKSETTHFTIWYFLWHGPTCYDIKT